MNSKVKYDPWGITVDDLSCVSDKWASALFFLGNGHAGIRNNLPLFSGLDRSERTGVNAACSWKECLSIYARA